MGFKWRQTSEVIYMSVLIKKLLEDDENVNLF